MRVFSVNLLVPLLVLAQEGGNITAAAAPPPHEAQDAASADDLRKNMEFIGFTFDESLSAWRVYVTHTHWVGRSEVIDRYTLIKLVESDTRNVVGTFRASDIQRKRLKGPKGPWRDKDIEATNPGWQAAQPFKTWNKYRRRLKFHSDILKMTDSTVRLRLDPHLDTPLVAEELQIVARAKPGQPVGFVPVARLMDGAYLNLGHYRVEGKPDVAWYATVEVHHSRTAKHVAVVCRFYENDNALPTEAMATVTSTGKEPLGTYTIGAMQMTTHATRQAGEMFKEEHPDISDLYDFYIGESW